MQIQIKIYFMYDCIYIHVSSSTFFRHIPMTLLQMSLNLAAQRDQAQVVIDVKKIEKMRVTLLLLL